MNSTRSRLVIMKGDTGRWSLDPDEVDSLKAAFDVIEVEDADAARRVLEDTDSGPVLCLWEQFPELAQDGSPPHGAAAILQHIGEGVGVVSDKGKLVWVNAKLKRLPIELREEFIDTCAQAIVWINEHSDSEVVEADGEVAPDSMRSRSRQVFAFQHDQSYYEIVVSPVDGQRSRSTISTVVGVLWDVTASRKLQNKIDAIDAAGSELMNIQSAQIAKKNMAERLKWLEEKIVHYVHDLLNFDNFEIRLLNKETKQLELVIAVGIAPLKIGEVIYAEKEGNGISGYVAATGEPYICPDVRKDPRYREGLDNASSSLTVPLYLHDQIIGVFNAESYTQDVFDENDRRFAEIFGRYIAIAMNILDLMVVERFTTNEQVAQNVVNELDVPLGDITALAQDMLDKCKDDGAMRDELSRMLQSARGLRDRVAACTRGPRTILGAEQELRKHEIDPLMQNKRVLVADDEPSIRETICSILTQKGALVTVCKDGAETIDAIERAAATGTPYDLVISDIKMPDRNGYEVFRTAKQAKADTPVVLMTGFGYDPHHSIVRSSQEGLDSFLFKPFQASQLVETVTKALTHKA